MKKLITICLLLATAFSVNAQTKKLGKEETIAYLDRVLKLSNGEIFKRANNPNPTALSECSFAFDLITYTCKVSDEDNHEYTTNVFYSNIKWESCNGVLIVNSSDSYSDNLIDVKIIFDMKYKFTMDKHIYFENDMYLKILKTKADSFKKAIERLVEIAKEENKDPF